MHKKKLISILEKECLMSNHFCNSFCVEYGCKDRRFNDLSKGNTFTNPKPQGECPVNFAGVNSKEPLPKKNVTQPIWEMVVEDMKERDLVGEQRYGMKLQKFNGRNSAKDAYQEILDFTVYARQWLEERKEMVEVLKYYSNPNKWGGNSQEAEADYVLAKNLLKKLGELE